MRKYLISFVAGMSIFSNVEAATVTVDINFDTDDLHILEGESLSASVDFGGTINYLQYLTFNFTFEDDLLDPGEDFFIGPFYYSQGSSSIFGQYNRTAESMDSVTIALSSSHSATRLFWDGIEDFGVFTRQGSVNIAQATIRGVGQYVPEPVPLPMSVWLFVSGLFAILSLANRKTAK
jgi:hypothetical protein